MTLDPMPFESPATALDMEIMSRQLGRTMRGVVSIARRCACGAPAVVRTLPRLPSGAPFPTSFYLTLPSLVEEISRVEATGTLAEWTEELAGDPEAQRKHRRAHEHFLERRDELGDVEEIRGISCGGMPERVKCLHALAGHALAEGPGLNPYGDRVLEQIAESASIERCRCEDTPASVTAEWEADGTRPTDRVAAIDCGTNSIRLLIADAADDPDRPGGPALTDIDRTMTIVRLGYGVDRTGVLDPEAIDRTLEALRSYKQRIDAAGVAPAAVRFVATSATRDASNRDDFVRGVRSILGIDPEVIDGAEEATLSFQGAVTSLPSAPEAPSLVVDIGGGSTELIIGAEEPEAEVSLNIGSVRIMERHLQDDPPSEDAIRAAERDIDEMLDTATEIDLSRVRSLVGVAGTVTTMTAHALGLDQYEPDAIHGAETDVERFAELCEEMARTPRAEREQMAYIHPGRVDVIGAGALVWARILRRVAAEGHVSVAVTSEHDILDGIALSALRRLRVAEAEPAPRTSAPTGAQTD